MCEGDEGLSLDALARRLEALEQENAGLRDEVSALKGSGMRRKAANLFVCTKGGTPGTWRKITTTAV